MRGAWAWVKGHASAVGAGVATLFLAVLAGVAASFRRPPALPPGPEAGLERARQAERARADALIAAEGLKARREATEAQAVALEKPTPAEAAIADMDAETLANEWKRLKKQ